jgi:hypothetical protein
MVLRCWLGFASGGYVGHGETYWNEEEVLWWAKGGKLHGESAPRIAFLRRVIEETPGYGLSPLAELPYRIIPDGNGNKIAAGYHGADYFLFYFGMHQPRFREFCLPEGSFRIGVLDTWNMTINTVADNASGQVRVELPRQKYLAIRIVRET